MLSFSEAEVLAELDVRRKWSTAREIAVGVGKSRSRVASVLKVLYRRDVLEAKKSGTRMFYRVNSEAASLLNRKPAFVVPNLHPARESRESTTTRLYFGFMNDAVTLYNSKKVAEAFSFEGKEALSRFIEAFALPVIDQIWEIKPGFWTNYDFDLLPLRADPEFLRAAASQIIAEFSDLFANLDGVVSIRGKARDVRSLASGTYTYNSVPLAAALSLKIGIPLIVFNDRKMFGEIKEWGNYLIVDDAPIDVREVEKVVARINERASTAVLVLVERNGVLKRLRENGVKCHSVFGATDIVHRVYKELGNIFLVMGGERREQS